MCAALAKQEGGRRGLGRSRRPAAPGRGPQSQIAGRGCEQHADPGLVGKGREPGWGPGQECRALEKTRARAGGDGSPGPQPLHENPTPASQECEAASKHQPEGGLGARPPPRVRGRRGSVLADRKEALFWQEGGGGPLSAAVGGGVTPQPPASATVWVAAGGFEVQVSVPPLNSFRCDHAASRPMALAHVH